MARPDRKVQPSGNRLPHTQYGKMGPKLKVSEDDSFRRRPACCGEAKALPAGTRASGILEPFCGSRPGGVRSSCRERKIRRSHAWPSSDSTQMPDVAVHDFLTDRQADEGHLATTAALSKRCKPQPSPIQFQAASTSDASKYFTFALVKGLHRTTSHFSHLRSPTIAMRSKSP